MLHKLLYSSALFLFKQLIKGHIIFTVWGKPKPLIQKGRNPRFPWVVILDLIFCVHSEMTLLLAQPKSLEPAPACAATTEDPEQRMLEKRSKVIEELLQTEGDYIKDLNMCKREIILPLKDKQVSTTTALCSAINSARTVKNLIRHVGEYCL